MKKLFFTLFYWIFLIFLLYIVSCNVLFIDDWLLLLWGIFFLLPAFLFLFLFRLKRKRQKRKIRQSRERVCTRKREIYPLPFICLGAILLLFGIFFLPKRQNVPQSLLDLQKRYPEAKSYVKNYHKYKDKTFDIDLSKEIKEGQVPLFFQRDKRWGYQRYGDDLMGITGCGPTCLSMVACALRQDSIWTPLAVAQMSMENHYYVQGVGTSWDLMTLGCQPLGIAGETGEISSDYIFAHLSPQSPMICSVKPGDFTTTGHFIVLAGIDKDQKIIVNDPNSEKNSKKHWEADRLLPQIKGIWKYQ